MVVAQDPAAAGEGVLAELTGLLILPQLPQGDGEDEAERRVWGWSSPRTRRQRVRVSSPSWRACSNCPNSHKLKGETAGRFQRVGVVIAQHGAAQVPGAFEQRPGGAGSPRVCRYSAARWSSQATSSSTPVRLR